MKTCTKCGAVKSAAEFTLDACKRDGRRPSCRACDNIKKAGYREKNRRALAAAQREYQKRTRPAATARSNAWAKANPGKIKTAARRWRTDNKAKMNAFVVAYRAEKLQATPAWTNHVAVGEFYALAALKTQLAGVPYHVDHIVPLRSPLVCGLHTHYNLQILSGEENRAKGNRRWPDMPEQGVRP